MHRRYTHRIRKFLKIAGELSNKKEPRWIHAASKGFTTKNGTLHHINGIISDITKLKRTKEVLSEKELALHAKTIKLEETKD